MKVFIKGMAIEEKILKVRVVALNVDTAFIQILYHGEWVQVKLSESEFISFMFANFKWLYNEAKAYNFDDRYQLANWLYNYGESESKDTYIFTVKGA